MKPTGALVSIVLLAALAACGGDSGSDDATPGSSATSATSTTAGTTAGAQGGAEDEFLRLTAAHLCAVQSTVYDDAAGLAAAYDEAPDYPSLSDEEVADFGKRVRSDPDFSAQLLEQVTTACG